MYLIGVTERFNLALPLAQVEAIVMLECHLLRLNINLDVLDLRKFRTHVLDHGSTGAAVDSWNSNNSLHDS